MQAFVLRWVITGITFLGLLPAYGQEGVIILPGISRNQAVVTSISFESSRSELKLLGQRAFTLHGGFKLVDARDASYALRMEPIGPTSVQLIIKELVNGNGNGKIITTERLEGSDLNAAFLKACDRAVFEISGKPGFFSGKLAFIGKRRGVSEIYTSDIFFRSVRPLTADRALVTGPSWSPDGSQLLYTTYFKSGFPDIYLMDFKKGVRQPVASYKGTNTGGRFSPDGKSIAMVISGGADTEICVSDALGKGLKSLTRNKSLESGPSWSPDGKRLVYTSDARGKPQLYMMSATGGQSRRIPTQISGFCTEPTWNPSDSNLIAFTASVGGSFQVCIYDFKLGKTQIVTKVSGSAVEPTWLNDGRHLIFTHRSGARTTVTLLDTKTGQTHALHRAGFGSSSSASFVYPALR